VIATAALSRAFDVVVVVHAVVAIAAFVVLVTLRSAAASVGRGEPTATAQRSFTGAPELAGRTVHLVPLSGLGVLAVSRGVYGLGSTFVLIGLALWLVAAVCLEVVAFPAQRAVAGALSTSEGSAVGPALRMARSIDGALLSIVLAAIVMVAAQR
jgi:hypothetical protein